MIELIALLFSKKTLPSLNNHAWLLLILVLLLDQLFRFQVVASRTEFIWEPENPKSPTGLYPSDFSKGVVVLVMAAFSVATRAFDSVAVELDLPAVSAAKLSLCLVFIIIMSETPREAWN